MKILVFGSNGMVGSSIVKLLQKNNSITDVIGSQRSDTNLFDYKETSKKISEEKPDIIINAAAKVGGIVANNTQRTNFILDNLKININILESIINFPEIKIINLGSSCIYPLGAQVPIKESSLMSGKLEPTNSPYAMAKLTAIEMGDALSKEFGHKVLNLMPTNLYGPNDNFSPLDSHVIPGLIYRMHEAKSKEDNSFNVWGTGKPLREFLFVEDLSRAVEFFINNEIFEGLFNVGSGEEISIKTLVKNIQDVVEYEGKISFDSTKPDGNPRKLLDTTKLFNFGWRPKISLSDGLDITYDWYKKSLS